MRLKSRASVKSWRRSSVLGRFAFAGQSSSGSTWSARKRCLQARQSTSGSVKPGEVPAGLPHARVLEDRRVQGDDVVALLEHRPPPLVLDVGLEQHAVVAVVVRRARGRRRSREDGKMKPRRLQRATIFSMVTASSAHRTALPGHARVPIYEYRRPDGTTFEVMQKMTDDPLTHDPETGVPVERVFTPLAVHFKGKGFYNTDYGTKKRNREKASEKSSSSSDSSSNSSDVVVERLVGLGPRRRPRRRPTAAQDSSSSTSLVVLVAPRRTSPTGSAAAAARTVVRRDVAVQRAQDVGRRRAARSPSRRRRRRASGRSCRCGTPSARARRSRAARTNPAGDSVRDFIAAMMLLLAARAGRGRSRGRCRRSCGCGRARAPGRR